jgi:2-polyprenyl-3-methyl-5-hydroxy-6-metoxy-1,4-benzoquinol methylase
MRLPLALQVGIPSKQECPNCGHSGVLFDAIRCEYFGCQRCLYYRVEPIPSVEAVTKYYENAYSYQVYTEVSDATYLGRAKRMMRALKLDKPPIRVLEIGPAGGGSIAGFSMMGSDVLGIDICNEVMENLQTRFKIPCLISGNTVGAMRMLSGEYDLIVFNHVLEHLIDPFTVLKEARKLLSPDGLCFVAVPNAFSLDAWIYGDKWAWVDPIGHIHNWSSTSLRRTIDNSGFQIVRGYTSQAGETITSRYPVITKLIAKSGLGCSSIFIVRGNK